MSKELPNIDLGSRTWVELKQYMLREADNQVKMLKNPTRNIDETNVIRGHLLFIDSILGLEDKILKNNKQAF